MSILNTSVSGMTADSELAIVNFPECRQRQHHRIQERRDRLLDLGRSDRQRRPGLRGRLHEPSLAQLAARQRRLHFNADRSRCELTLKVTAAR